MGITVSEPDIPEQVTTTPVYHNRTTTPPVLAPTATPRLNSPQRASLARRVQQLNSPERAALALCINHWKETTLALRYDYDTPVTVKEVISPPISPPRSEEEMTIATMANKDSTEFGQCFTLAKDLKDSPKKLQAMRNTHEHDDLAQQSQSVIPLPPPGVALTARLTKEKKKTAQSRRKIHGSADEVMTVRMMKRQRKLDKKARSATADEMMRARMKKRQRKQDTEAGLDDGDALEDLVAGGAAGGGETDTMMSPKQMKQQRAEAKKLRGVERANMRRAKAEDQEAAWGA